LSARCVRGAALVCVGEQCGASCLRRGRGAFDAVNVRYFTLLVTYRQLGMNDCGGKQKRFSLNLPAAFDNQKKEALGVRSQAPGQARSRVT
jgi:hypothetical protein